MSQFLPATRTHVEPRDMFEALWDAWLDQFGDAPSGESLALLVAHWALETGRGASMWNFNVGNIKGKPGDPERDWTFFRCNEVINGKTVWFDPPNPGCCFRAYACLEEGVADYLALLAKRFASAWPSVIAGDPAGFVHALKVARYFTANEVAYTKAVVALFDEFKKTLLQQDA